MCVCISVVYVTTLSVYQEYVMFMVRWLVNEHMGRFSVISHCFVDVLSRHWPEGTEGKND